MGESAVVRSEETQKTQVDPETAERFIAEKRIGERIKRLRLKKSMGLVELGKHTGLSASFLSQLETGRGRVPPDRYRDWARALNIDARPFVRQLLSYYDPVTYDILFGEAD